MPLDPHRAYRVLGVEAGATLEDVKSAFRDLAQVWHPDRFPIGSRLRDKAERNLKRITEAYALLKDYQPPPHPAPRRMRDSLSAILDIGDLRDSAAFRAPGPVLRRSIRILGLDQMVDSRPRRRVWWVLIAAVAVALVLWRLVLSVR